MFAGAMLAIAAGVAVVLMPGDKVETAKVASERPPLLLLTSLPLVFSESFGLGGGSATLSRLEQSFKVVPIAAAERASLQSGAVLLMAHPRAQPAEQLVELDEWVRKGGRLVLLADPALRWPSEKPLGDITRPPPGFADTGLLRHWALSLVGPEPDGPAMRTIGGKSVMAAAPGTLARRPGSTCAILDDGFVARCALGKGRVMVIADADFLNVAGEGALDGPTEGNLDALVAALESLATQ